MDTVFSNLKSGGILVRLKTQENVLKALEGKNDQLAKKIKNKRDADNREVIDAFRGFNYCPIYFFYSSNSVKIKNREFKDILLDFNLNPVPDSLNLNENYVIATFDFTQKDTSSYWMNSEYSFVWTQKEGEYVAERRMVDLYGSPSFYNTGVSGLILFSPELVSLQEVRDEELIDYGSLLVHQRIMNAFSYFLTNKNIAIYRYPHYIPTYEGLPFRRPKEKAVKQLQLELERMGKEYFNDYPIFQFNSFHEFQNQIPKPNFKPPF